MGFATKKKSVREAVYSDRQIDNWLLNNAQPTQKVTPPGQLKHVIKKLKVKIKVTICTHSYARFDRLLALACKSPETGGGGGGGNSRSYH